MPSSRNPAYMAPEDIVGEISNLRDGIEQGARRIFELSRALHDRMRRMDPNSQDIHVFITYSNVWTRFSGMVQQGLQRTRQANRILRLLPEERRAPPEAAPPAEVQVVEPAEEAHTMPVSSPLEDFMTVYGEEYMRDAADRQRQR